MHSNFPACCIAGDSQYQQKNWPGFRSSLSVMARTIDRFRTGYCVREITAGRQGFRGIRFCGDYHSEPEIRTIFIEGDLARLDKTWSIRNHTRVPCWYEKQFSGSWPTGPSKEGSDDHLRQQRFRSGGIGQGVYWKAYIAVTRDAVFDWTHDGQ